MIDVQRLTKTYAEGAHERLVLQDLDMQIDRGAFVVLMGRSGSGKSTLLNLISGIDRPTSGSIRVGDAVLTELSDHERTLFRRQHIGFVFQSFNLISTLTVEENVMLPLELRGDIGAEERERARHVLEQVGLMDRADSFPDRLSGGEQQRVAVARALAHDPLLILTDEPTGNLDYETGRQVLDLLTELVDAFGKTMLAATHDRTMARRADRLLLLKNGRLTAQRPEDVLMAGEIEV